MRFHAFIRIQFFDTFVCASFLSQITRSHHQFPGLHSRNALLSHHSGGNHDVRNSEGSHVFCLHAVSPRSFYEMVLLSRRTCSMTICRRAMPTTTSIWSSTPIPSPRRWRTRNRWRACEWSSVAIVARLPFCSIWRCWTESAFGRTFPSRCSSSRSLASTKNRLQRRPLLENHAHFTCSWSCACARPKSFAACLAGWRLWTMRSASRRITRACWTFRESLSFSLHIEAAMWRCLWRRPSLRCRQWIRTRAPWFQRTCEWTSNRWWRRWLVFRWNPRLFISVLDVQLT